MSASPAAPPPPPADRAAGPGPAEPPELLRNRAVLVTLVVLLLAFAAAIRFADLETNPPGFWQDEASTGLDAYLIWNTGQDRAGADYPIISRSFGDYPLAGYRYLVAPILGVLGPTPGNHRLVSAFFGTWLVLVTFWVTRRRFGIGPGIAALMSAALTPTWIHFSRYGSEAILLPACLATGWALIDEGRRKRAFIWLGAAALAGSAYTYHAVKLVLPLWMLGFLIFQWPLIRDLWKREKVHLFGPALLFALLVFPSVQAALTLGGMARGRTVLAWYHYSGMRLFRTVLSNYLSYFDPGMLFVRGGPAVAQSIPGLGMWNMIELPLVGVGLFTLFRDRARWGAGAFVLFWFLLGPLPGGVTYETHNMGRAIAWLPAPQILSGWGLWVVVRWAWTLAQRTVRDRRALVGYATLIALIGGWGATFYAVWWCTMVRYPEVTTRDWQFEVTEAMRCALEHRKDETIIVSPRFPVASVFAAFHFAKQDEANGEPIWQLGDRTRVRSGEIYLLPTRDPLPTGEELCRVVHTPTQKVYAYVIGPSAAPTPSKVGVPTAPGQIMAPRLDIGRGPLKAAQPPPRLDLRRRADGPGE